MKSQLFKSIIALHFLMFFSQATAEKVEEVEYSLVLKNANPFKVSNIQDLFAITRENFSEAKIIFLFSDNVFEFALFEIPQDQQKIYAVIVNPHSGITPLLHINDVEKTGDLSLFGMNEYAALHRVDGSVEYDKSKSYVSPLGYIINVYEDDTIKFSVRITDGSVYKTLNFERTAGDAWTFIVK